jgi:hypothetical protein
MVLVWEKTFLFFCVPRFSNCKAETSADDGTLHARASLSFFADRNRRKLNKQTIYSRSRVGR